MLAPERLAERHVARLAAELDLTDEQRETLETLMRERVPRLVEFRERMLEARANVAEAYRGRRLDGHRFREMVAALRGVQAGLDSLTTEIMLKEAEVLTPEQRDRYLDVMPWSLDGPGRAGGRGGPPGGSPGAGPPPHRRPRGGI
jgi:Spy/CpxP family protein refolding chaperone